MIVSCNWLKELVDFSCTAEELAHRLTMVGLEVEGIERLGTGLETVVVAQLEAVVPHPNADKLTVCQLQTGSETVQVVCGARNHKAGDLVALAQPGTLLPGDFRIKKSKIRGEESCGMLCSETELGLAEASEGILILPPGLPLGLPVFDALGLTDVRLTIGLTPNRPDCLSHVGVAREIAAMHGGRVHLPTTQPDEAGEPIAALTSVTLADSDLCPRYAARLIRGVTVGPSPDWLVRRLEAVGLRSINNVVDVTNYVLMELGHPLHAFDFNRLRERRILVRRAAEGERFTTLDGQERLLTGEDLVIADGAGAVALAGIMGGQNSEVDDATVDILLESAWFKPGAIRRTSKRLGMHTEASHRFERGADIDMAPVALDRAAALIVQVAGGVVAPGRIDAYPQVLPPRLLELSPRRANELLGLTLSPERMQELLAGIELSASLQYDGGEPRLQVQTPSFRPDLEREIDLIEELARLHGYDRIAPTMPAGEMLPQRRGGRQQRVAQLRELMVAAGFAEVVNYSFVSPSSWDRLGVAADDSRRQTVAVLNPLTEDQAVMRTSLIPSLLETAARNLKYQAQDLRLFELRPVFQVRTGEELPAEPLRLTALLCGRREPEGWAQSPAAGDYYDLKGVVETVLERLLVDKVRWQADAAEPYLHPGKSARIEAGRTTIGCLGELHPETQAAFDLERPVYLFDLDVEALLAAARDFGGFRALSRYPEVYRDSALLLPEAVTAQELFQVLGGISLKNVENVVLFDLYCGGGIPAGKKSMAIRVRYRSMEKTLTDAEISASHDKLIRLLGDKVGAEIR